MDTTINKPKKIGILTSGGDCPGLNAIIRSVVKCATKKGWLVYGIPYGTDGFIRLVKGVSTPEDYILSDRGYDIPGGIQGLDILQFLSGSILGSFKKRNLDLPEITQDIIDGYNQLKLDALIAIGGDGSMDIIYDLAKIGKWNLVMIPKTIDNDVAMTERSVGFDTARNTVTQALYDLTFTAASHERVIVVEVMGRDAGHLALHAGIAGGADCILIPEIIPKLTEELIKKICAQIADLQQKGRKFALIAIAEGVKNMIGEKEKYIGEQLADLIQQYSQQLSHSEDNFLNLEPVETRATTLGHLQRCGIPSSFDRILATVFGIKAVNLIEQNQYNRLVIWENGSVNSKSLENVIPLIKWCHQQSTCPSPVDPNGFMVETARSIGILLGD